MIRVIVYSGVSKSKKQVEQTKHFAETDFEDAKVWAKAQITNKADRFACIWTCENENTECVSLMTVVMG